MKASDLVRISENFLVTIKGQDGLDFGQQQMGDSYD